MKLLEMEIGGIYAPYKVHSNIYPAEAANLIPKEWSI
jgi:hypothetical protein